LLQEEDDISYAIIGAAIDVHRELGGPGLLENVYEQALYHELRSRGFQVRRQVDLPIRFKNIVLSTPLRLDLLVNEKVIIECKSVMEFHPVFEAQALTYLRITGLKLALVINFGEIMVKDGIRRVVN
jgi:GxxExxY protein